MLKPNSSTKPLFNPCVKKPTWLPVSSVVTAVSPAVSTITENVSSATANWISSSTKVTPSAVSWKSNTELDIGNGSEVSEEPSYSINGISELETVMNFSIPR